MRLFEHFIYKITGKILDERVTLNYMLQRGVPILFSLIRGALFSFFHGNVKNKIMIGKKVNLFSKNQIKLSRNVRIDNYVTIDALSVNGVSIGENSKIGEYSKIIGSGTITDLGEGLVIGKNSFFSDHTFFGAAGGIQIGDDVISGQMVRFHAENHNFDELSVVIRKQGVNRKGIIIGNDCWIGAGATFLDGSKVGNGCVIAANALVTKEFPDNVIIGGIPVKILNYRGLQ